MGLQASVARYSEFPRMEDNFRRHQEYETAAERYLEAVNGLRETMFAECGVNECIEESKEPEIYMKYKEVFS